MCAQLFKLKLSDAPAAVSTTVAGPAQSEAAATGAVTASDASVSVVSAVVSSAAPVSTPVKLSQSVPFLMDISSLSPISPVYVAAGGSDSSEQPATPPAAAALRFPSASVKKVQLGTTGDETTDADASSALPAAVRNSIMSVSYAGSDNRSTSGSRPRSVMRGRGERELES